VFKHPAANGFDVGEIALLHPRNGPRGLGARHRVQQRKPVGKRLLAVLGHVVADLKHDLLVTQTLPSSKGKRKTASKGSRRPKKVRSSSSLEPVANEFHFDFSQGRL